MELPEIARQILKNKTHRKQINRHEPLTEMQLQEAIVHWRDGFSVNKIAEMLGQTYINVWHALDQYKRVYCTKEELEQRSINQLKNKLLTNEKKVVRKKRVKEEPKPLPVQEPAPRPQRAAAPFPVESNYKYGGSLREQEDKQKIKREAVRILIEVYQRTYQQFAGDGTAEGKALLIDKILELYREVMIAIDA